MASAEADLPRWLLETPPNEPLTDGTYLANLLTMQKWEQPRFVEWTMNAEIGAYQAEEGGERPEPYFLMDSEVEVKEQDE